MRQRPGPVGGVTGESALDLIEERGPCHSRHRLLGEHDAGRLLQQPGEQRRGRELRCGTEPSVDRVCVLAQNLQRTVGEFLVVGSGEGLSLVLVMAHGHRGGQLTVAASLVPQGCCNLLCLLLDLLAALGPCFPDGFAHLGEGGDAPHALRRKVGPGVEDLAMASGEDTHRPAALAGERLGGCHVGIVDLRVLFAVNFDGYKALIEQSGQGWVLEGFSGHNMAPVAGRVADR